MKLTAPTVILLVVAGFLAYRLYAVGRAEDLEDVAQERAANKDALTIKRLQDRLAKALK